MLLEGSDFRVYVEAASCFELFFVEGVRPWSVSLSLDLWKPEAGFPNTSLLQPEVCFHLFTPVFIRADRAPGHLHSRG